MRIWLLLTFSLVFVDSLFGQRDRPRIEDQRPVSTDEDTPVTIQLTDLIVRDRDDWFYPFGFTLSVQDGKDYTRSDNTVTPAQNFNGKLKVTVTVNDGEHDSRPYDLEVTVRPVNDAPVITAQIPLHANENHPITLKVADLTINDPDDNQFTLTLSPGENYTISGTTITPATDYSGPLTVPVTVSDGEASSAPFNVKIDILPVNDIPTITGQVSLTTSQGKAITVELAHLTVKDADNPYPTGFTLEISAPANNTYTVNGNTVQPAPNFDGVLSVPLRVSDGKDYSPSYNFQITVTAANTAPVITGQSPVSIKEDEVFTLQFSHLFVTDPDNVYPNGFTLKIANGPNYTVNGTQITPAADFTGKLVASVTVNDGTNTSAPFNFEINVGSTNDSPVVTLEADPLIFRPGNGPVNISEALQITDSEMDSIVQAEISFFAPSYTPGYDELRFPGNEIIRSTFDLQRGILLLTGKGTIQDYATAIKTIQYNFIAMPDAFTEGKKISIKVSDRFSTSAPATREIRTRALDIDLDIPSGFTPNGDSANDTWMIRPLKASEELAGAIIRVYNRTGVLLFETVGFDTPWDGKANGTDLPSDSYFYTIDLGSNYLKKPIRGIVTILR